MNPTLFVESNDIEESSLTLHNIHRHGFKKQRETFFWNLRKKINYYLKFIGSTYKKIFVNTGAMWGDSVGFFDVRNGFKPFLTIYKKHRPRFCSNAGFFGIGESYHLNVKFIPKHRHFHDNRYRY